MAVLWSMLKYRAYSLYCLVSKEHNNGYTFFGIIYRDVDASDLLTKEGQNVVIYIYANVFGKVFKVNNGLKG